MVRAEVTEQIENTSDIGFSKHELIEMYPELSESLDQLPDPWWWHHPSRWMANHTIATASNNNMDHNSINSNDHKDNISLSNNNRIVCPRTDADLLISHVGKLPAGESKYMVRKRCLYFLKWLYSDIDKSSNNNKNNNDNNNININIDINNNINQMSPVLLDNVAIFSHSCTMKEFELMLLSLLNETEKEQTQQEEYEEIKKMQNKSNENENENANENENSNTSGIGFRKNTEVVSYKLPSNPFDIDWQLLEKSVDDVRGVLNHADHIERINNNDEKITPTDCISYGHENIYGNDPLTLHLEKQFEQFAVSIQPKPQAVKI